MVKNIEIVDVGSENTEAPKEVEETKQEEPIIKSDETQNIQNDIPIETEQIKEPINEVVEEPTEEPKKDLKSKTYSTEKVECPKCKRYLTKYTFKYRHNCNGMPVKKEPDPNKVVRRTIMHPQQAEEFKDDVCNRVKDN